MKNKLKKIASISLSLFFLLILTGGTAKAASNARYMAEAFIENCRLNEKCSPILLEYTPKSDIIVEGVATTTVGTNFLSNLVANSGRLSNIKDKLGKVENFKQLLLNWGDTTKQIKTELNKFKEGWTQYLKNKENNKSKLFPGLEKISDWKK